MAQDPSPSQRNPWSPYQARTCRHAWIREVGRLFRCCICQLREVRG